MIRPHIPVRDGLRRRPYLRARSSPEVGQVEYVSGWRWGMLCGLVAGVLVTLVACKVLA